ncbi:MAG: DUF4321 domain-containing protein [Lachnospiraceae bacterium]|nr:DUF4321 domain-containing protein [Lachnospiraceae bacterium]
MLAGIVIGGFLAHITTIEWLNYGQTFGSTTPLVLDLGLIVLTIGLTIHITVGSLIGIVIAIICYHYM